MKREKDIPVLSVRYKIRSFWRFKVWNQIVKFFGRAFWLFSVWSEKIYRHLGHDQWANGWYSTVLERQLCNLLSQYRRDAPDLKEGSVDILKRIINDHLRMDGMIRKYGGAQVGAWCAGTLFDSPDKRTCCVIGCQEKAEWIITGDSNEMYNVTESCTAHVGSLLDDSNELRIQPIKNVG